MEHRGDEIGALAAERLGLLGHRGDGRGKSQVLRARRAGGVVVGRAGQADAHAVEVEDRPVLEAGERRAIGTAQIGGEQRKPGFAHALEECRLAEIELMVAGYEDVGWYQIGQRDDVGAAVEPRHQRGRQGVPRMGEDHVAAFGALSLDDGSELGKPAAALAVGCQVCAHLIDIVDQDERDRRPRGLGVARDRRRGEPETREDDCDEAAVERHGSGSWGIGPVAYRL